MHVPIYSHILVAQLGIDENVTDIIFMVYDIDQVYQLINNNTVALIDRYIVSQSTNHIRAFSMCLNKINYSARKQTNCYIKYDREILGLIELIENVVEFVLKIKYPWLCITSRHVYLLQLEFMT